MIPANTPAGWTGGPHAVEGRNISTEVSGFNLICGGGEVLAYVACNGDATLYAAAPDLYAACAAAEEYLSCVFEAASEVRAQCTAALAKARGEGA